MEYAAARALLERLGEFLDQFVSCFGRRVQRRGASRYVRGLLNDSERKSIEALHGRLNDAGSYQGLQHFITHSPWDTARVWRRLRAILPVRRGVLVIDETSFPKQGTHSVGVGRQYCGALGKIANCQVAVSTMVVAAGLSWPTTLELYVPRDWADDEGRRERAGIPQAVRFRTKWQLALRHIRQVRSSRLTLDAVVGDADYGKVLAFRTALERMPLRYAVGIPWSLMAWTGGAKRTRTAREIAAQLPASAWHRIAWGHGVKRPWAARFATLRVRPAKSRTDCWLLCERSLTGTRDPKYYLVQVPTTWSLKQLVTLAHSRWQIEQHYQELKDELGLDHFEGRSWRGWHHHGVLAALTYTFLQLERQRGTHPLPTFPSMRNLVREIVATLFFITQPQWLDLLVDFQRNPPLRI